jgi:hypothetical protein
MKTAYFDCFSGISGDMITGSLLDAGMEIDELGKELDKLHLTGYKISCKKEERKTIVGTKFYVDVTPQKEWKMMEILCAIDESDLENDVKEKSKAIFKRLAEAEAKIHGVEPSEVHLHETGGVDAIVDIVSAVISIKKLGIKRIYSSRLNVGRGFLECEHGRLPVPAPATIELLKGVPVYSTGVESELVTPTGAAIITTLSCQFGNLPETRIEKTGYGLGSKDLPTPNALRVLIGETKIRCDEDIVAILETNIDDMNPQVYEYVMDRLFKKGALDVFLTPVYMKKSRPGTKLSVISPLSKVDEHLEVIFRETTTLGVRIQEVKRKKVYRNTIFADTKYGKIRVKVAETGDGCKKYFPEYEDCKKIANERNIPLKDVYEEAIRNISRL